MNRIQKVSSYLIIIFNVLLVVIPPFIVSLWFLKAEGPLSAGSVFDSGWVWTPEGVVDTSMVKWTTLTKFIGCMANIISVLPFLLGLFVLKSIFQNYRKGRIFTVVNARQYKYLGWLFFMDAFFSQPLSATLMILAVTFSNPPGHRILHIGFGSPNMGTIFYGVLVLVISWIMLEASKLQEEQALVV